MAKAVLLCAIAICSCCAVQAQTDGVLFSFGFETGSSGVITMDQKASVNVTIEPDQVRSGDAALQLTYEQRPPEGEDDLPGSVIVLLPESPPRTAAIGFSVWSSLPVHLMVMLMERDSAARYNTIVRLEHKGWQDVVLPLDAFMADDGGPLDPDGRPTPDQLAAIALVDMASLLAPLSDVAEIPTRLAEGQQFLRLDDLKLLDETALQRTTRTAADTLRIGDYAWPPRDVIILGGTGRSVWADKADDDRPAIVVEGTNVAGTVTLILHRVPLGSMGGVKRITFRAKCLKDAELHVGVQEQIAPGQVGPTYTAVRQVSAARGWQTISVPVEELLLEKGDDDPDGVLNLATVVHLTIADVTALTGNQDVKNVLWLSDLVAIK